MTVKSNPYEWSKFIPLAKNSQKFNLFFWRVVQCIQFKATHTPVIISTYSFPYQAKENLDFCNFACKMIALHRAI